MDALACIATLLVAFSSIGAARAHATPIARPIARPDARPPVKTHVRKSSRVSKASERKPRSHRGGGLDKIGQYIDRFAPLAAKAGLQLPAGAGDFAQRAVDENVRRFKSAVALTIDAKDLADRAREELRYNTA